MRRAVEVGDDPAHPVVRGGRDRDELARRVEARLLQRADDVREQRRVDVAHVEVDRRPRPSRVIRVPDRPRDLVARGELVDEALAVRRRAACAPSPRIASVTRNPSRPGTPVTAVGWNCMNSRSASAAPAAWASSRPIPSEPGGFVVRDQSAAAPPVASTTPRDADRAAVLADDPDAAPVGASTARRRASPRGPRCAGPRRRARRGGGRRAGRSRCRRRGRPGAGCGRPRARARGCRGGRRRSARRARSRSATMSGASRHEHRGRARAHERRGRRARCPRRCWSGESSIGERRGEAALRPVARGLRERGGADERDPRARRARRSARRRDRPRRRRRRRRRPRWRGGRRHRRVPVPAMRAPVLLRHPSSLDARHRRASRAPARIVAIERGARRRATGSAGTRASPPRRRADGARGRAPRAYVDRDRAALRARAAADRPRHRRVSGLVGGGAARAPAARSRSSTRCSAARRASAPRRIARPATTPSRAGDGLLPVQQRRRRGAARAATRTALERVLILDWDVHHGNGTNDIFHATDAVLFVSIHESPLYPGTGPACDVGSGAGEGYTVNMPVPPARATRCSARSSSTSSCRSARAYAPELVLVSAGFDAHARRPARRAARDRRRASRRWRPRCGALAEELGVPARARARGRLRPRRARALARRVARGRSGRRRRRPPTRRCAVHPLATAAAQRLAERWPAFAS